MKIEFDAKKMNVVMTDIDGKLISKNFAAVKGLTWDRFQSGQQRKIRIKLSEDEANWFTAQGAKIIAFPATEEYPDPAYYVEVRISYKDKRAPNPGEAWNVFEHGPRVVNIVPGGRNVEYTEASVANLDKVRVTKMDLEVHMGPTNDMSGKRIIRNGIPGVTLYANRIYATTEPYEPNELDRRYENLTIEECILDDEDYAEFLEATK